MKRASEKLTEHIINAGIVPQNSYAVYQYGFQIGLEMLVCFGTCLIIAICLNRILEFIISMTLFMLLRTFAGGVHLNNFISCFICSVSVQTFVLYNANKVKLSMKTAWLIIVLSSMLIWLVAPVDNVNRELNRNERFDCKKKTILILIGVIVFTIVCTYINAEEIIALVALTMLVILISQYIGILKTRIEKKKMSGDDS